MTSPTNNAKLAAWVEEMTALCKPASVVWVDGSQEEYDRLCPRWSRRARSSGSTPPSAPTPISPAPIRPTWPASRTAPSSARQQGRRRPDQQLGAARGDARNARRLFDGCMRGRTMYVIPFSMGPLGSPIAHIGVEITDTPYVVANMRIMTRMGSACSTCSATAFVPCMHSVGAPLAPGQTDVPWPCNPDISANTSSTSRKPARSGPTARATAATRCSARSASRCASPR